MKTVNTFLYLMGIPKGLEGKLQARRYPLMGAFWFKEGTSLDTKLIRQILILVHIISLKHWSVHLRSGTKSAFTLTLNLPASISLFF